MTRSLRVALAVLAALPLRASGGAAPRSGAGLADAPEIGPIDPAALPDDPAVRKAWAEVRAQAPYAFYWYQEWRHPVPKEDVRKALSAGIAVLQRAARAADDREVLLALGIAGRFGHNVDLDGAAEIGLEALERAAARGGDPRAEWLLAGSYCHGNRAADGLPHLERAVAAARGRALPAGYWHDALFCGLATFMPVHQVRAARALDDLGALTSIERRWASSAEDLLVSPLLGEEYGKDRAVSFENVSATRVAVTVVPCGLRFVIDGAQRLGIQPVRNGTCFVQTIPGPFPGRTGDVSPGIVLLARAAVPEEPFEAFIDRLMPAERRAPAKDLPCPAARCTSYELHDPAQYPDEGGGLALVVAFEREAPAFPGLLLERPATPRSDKPGVNVYRLEKRLIRYPGKLRYYVLLDTAESVAPAARAELARFLAELLVE